MKLKRRDAIAALAAGGVGATALARTASRESSDDTVEASDLTESELSTLVAATEFLYPSEVSVEAGFVEAYTRRLSGARKRGLKDTIAGVETHARRRFGERFTALPVDDREALFRSMNVDKVSPNATGTLSARVRYYVVNGLLFALFTTPKGSALLGIENPVGHPGGYESYQRRPER